MCESLQLDAQRSWVCQTSAARCGQAWVHLDGDARVKMQNRVELRRQHPPDPKRQGSKAPDKKHRQED